MLKWSCWGLLCHGPVLVVCGFGSISSSKSRLVLGRLLMLLPGRSLGSSSAAVAPVAHQPHQWAALKDQLVQPVPVWFSLLAFQCFLAGREVVHLPLLPSTLLELTPVEDSLYLCYSHACPPSYDSSSCQGPSKQPHLSQLVSPHHLQTAILAITNSWIFLRFTQRK